MPIALRFPIAFVLPIVCLTTPAWSDFQAGMEAYNRKDYATALSEWRPLAERGDATTQYTLGLLYANGHGVPQDLVQARQWFEQAAAQGYARAQVYLGLMHVTGQGVPKDFIQAHKWYNLAAAIGDKEGVRLRDALAKQMTHAQIAEAKKLAREWKPKTP